jgi:alpha-tubulin suppressor-like RCC1 family protein
MFVSMRRIKVRRCAAVAVAFIFSAGLFLGAPTAASAGMQRSRAPGAGAERAAKVLKAVLGLSAKRIIVGQKLTATAARSVVPKGDKVTKITLSWGDGTKSVTLARLSTKPTHRYARAGRYTVRLKITDRHRKAVSSTAAVLVTVPPPPALGSAKQLVTDDEGYCALFSSGRVECWGYGEDGELGDGSYAESATPVAVRGVGGTGTLTGVASLGSDGQGVCAVLASGAVDCWGYGGDGELGDGSFAGSDVPVAVRGVGGSRQLTGVASLANYGSIDGRAGYCALLKSGGVDCWGWGYYGQLGDGSFYTTGEDGSDVPVAVKGTGGSGTLGGVTRLASTGSDGEASYCAVLSSGGVDCWGYGLLGQLGDGTFYTTGQDGSDVPVAVKGVGGSGALAGVASLSGGFDAYCAVVTAGAVDCWGDEGQYQLGNGLGGAANDSATPVAVLGVGGSGVLAGSSALANDGQESYCALLTSAGVVCWGGEESEVPAAIQGVGGSGSLAGVARLTATSFDGPSSGSYCAVLSTGAVDCWGFDYFGQLGDGGVADSGTPVKVAGVGGSGTLADVVQADGNAGNGDFCAILSSGRVDCWGYGEDGELGNGSDSNSDVPVAVSLP